MRDLDRWKDKVELQLDGRQIFFLFFGSAIAACMIFILGVVVGKRVESRSAALKQAPLTDPLAALDELGSTEEGLTFHSTLAEKRPATKREAPPPDEQRPEVPPSRLADGKKGPGPGEDDKAAGDKAADKAADKGAAKPDKPADKVAAAKPDKGAEKPADKAADKGDKKGHFTLQLSAFATKSEAVDFVKRLRESGYKPFMVESQVPGKGLMYRVRLGDYTTREGALTAKGDFERKLKMVAYVAKL